MVLRKGQENANAGPMRPLVTLSVVFVISLAAVGGLSLRQYRQIQELRRSSQEKNSYQLQTQYNLVAQLTRLHNFDLQMKEELGRQQLVQGGPGKDEDRSQLLQLQNVLQELSCQVKQLQEHASGAKETALPAAWVNRITDLREQLDASRDQVREVLDRQRRSEEILSHLSRGVCLIQGEYIFVDPKTEKPLRYMDGADGFQTAQTKRREIDSDFLGRSMEPMLSVSVNGKGRLLQVPYTGTGFLVDGRGYLLTNKHVTEPWLISREYRQVLDAGYRGKLSVFRAFFGGFPEPFEVQVAKVSDVEDVALLRAELKGREIPVLPCEQDPHRLKAGQTVIVLGYPTGFDVLLAQLRSGGTKAYTEDYGSTLEEIALTMAERGMIWPIGTRGMCGRIGEDKIIYDASTAIGGSGGPVIGQDGKVVAINTALLRSFAGTNFGIPVQLGLRLLDQVAPLKTPGEHVDLALGGDIAVSH